MAGSGVGLALEPAVVTWRERLKAARGAMGRAPLISSSVLAVLVCFALLAPIIAPHSPTQIDVGNSFSPPAWHEEGEFSNFLGTDKLGRDVFSRLIYGARVSLTLSLFIILIGGGSGTLLGILSGYLGKTADAVLQRFVELILALPTILVALVFVFTFGTSFTSVMFVVSPFLAARFIRIVRGETLTVR